MKQSLKNIYNDYVKFPLYILTHPFDGYEELKRYRKGKISVSVILIALFAFLRILQIQYNGFIMNDVDPSTLNSLKEMLSVILLVGLFVIGNWSITTLMEGKGNTIEILMITGYSLSPIIFIGYPSILISNVIGLEEIGIYSLIVGMSYIASIWMLFMGLLNIHEYGLGKTIASILFTVVSMLVMIFVALLFFDLISQFVTFIKMIWQELSLRF